MSPSRTASSSAEDAAKAHAEAQRQRILDAAQQCFIGWGFHAASIAEIAAKAEISQGLMYRYFDSKRALIFALIERQLAYDKEAIRHMPSPADLVDSLLLCYQHWARGETLETKGNAIASVVLFAQINAEAHRDPLIAEVLRSHDAQTSDAMIDWLKGYDEGQGATSNEAMIRKRVLLLRLLVEGLAMRAIRDPDLAPDVIRALLMDLIAQVFPDQTGTRAEIS